MDYREIELTDNEALVIRGFTETALGREGILPCGAMTSFGKEGLYSLINKGVIVELPQSDIDEYCAGKRYGLAVHKYPNSFDEFGEYRDSGWSEKAFYEEYLEALGKGDVVDDRDEINAHMSKVVDRFTELTKKDIYDYIEPIKVIGYNDRTYRDGDSVDKSLAIILHNGRKTHLDRTTYFDLAIKLDDSGDKGFLHIVKEITEMELAETEEMIGRNN